MTKRGGVNSYEKTLFPRLEQFSAQIAQFRVKETIIASRDKLSWGELQNLISLNLSSMKKYYTQLDLVRFIYKETSATETIAIGEALNINPLLQEEYEELCEGYRLLPKAKFSPKPSALKKVLRHSEQNALNPMH
jgi:hypothetical protein